MGLLKYIETLFPKAPTDKDMSLRRERTMGIILSHHYVVSEERAKEMKDKAVSYSFK